MAVKSFSHLVIQDKDITVERETSVAFYHILGLKSRDYVQFPTSELVLKMCTFRNEGDWSDMEEAVSS